MERTKKKLKPSFPVEHKNNEVQSTQGYSLPNKEPTSEDIYETWLEVLSVEQSDDKKFVELSIEHFSPTLARDWLILLVQDLNDAVRKRELADSERALTYFQNQLKTASTVEIKELTATLMRSHMESKMMASIYPDYVFTTIDPPQIPEEPSKPKKLVITLVFATLGLLITLSFLFYNIPPKTNATL